MSKARELKRKLIIEVDRLRDGESFIPCSVKDYAATLIIMQEYLTLLEEENAQLQNEILALRSPQ